MEPKDLLLWAEEEQEGKFKCEVFSHRSEGAYFRCMCGERLNELDLCPGKISHTGREVDGEGGLHIYNL